MRTEISLTLLSLLLASCTVGPDYQRPPMYKDSEIAASLGLKNQKAQEITKEWYRKFNDNTLTELIELSLKNSPDANIAIQKLRQARSEFSIASVNSFPMINLDGSYHYNKPSRNIGYTIDTDYYQTGLDASWELDIWGGNRRLSESKEALLKAAAANLDNVYVSLSAETAADYISLRLLQEQLRIAEQNLKLQEEIYQIVARKNEIGLADNAALNQARYAVETTKSLVPDLHQQIEQAQNALTILTGRLPGKLEAMLQSQEKSQLRHRFNYDLSKLYELPVETIRTRPDVRIAEQQLIAQNALVGQAISQLYPNVSLSGFMGFQAFEVSGLVGDKSYMYNYSPAINLPLLNWGQLKNQVELQKEMTLEAFYQYQKSVLAATAEIKDTMSALSHEYEKNQAAYNAALAQRKVTKLQLEKYQKGLIEFSDVLTAEQNLLSTQNALLASNAQIYQNIIAFYKAIGGGYAKETSEL